MSQTKCLYHIVFGTKRRFPSIPLDKRRDLYAYLYGILKNQNCYVHRINGMSEHIHIAIDLSPTIALSDCVKKLKVASSKWLKENPDFPSFYSWGKGYYAYTFGLEQLNATVNYIINQDSHHSNVSFLDEMKVTAEQCCFKWYEDDWE